jgi:Zn-dependent protease
VFNITPELVAAIAMILLISFPVHEFSHALVAYRLGDGTAKLFGRLTLNPVAHFDPLGALMLIASAIVGRGIGWAKPTPVNPNMLRGGRRADAYVAAAGPVSNLLLALAGAIVVRILVAANFFQSDQVVFAANIVYIFIAINISLFIFNLVPIPPLDGSKVMFALMDPRTVWQIRPMLEQYGMFFLLILVIVPVGSTTLGGAIIGPVIDAILRTLVGF